MNLPNISNFYKDFVYPKEFQKILHCNLVDLGIWYLMTEKQVETRIQGLQKRYPHRKLIPFARRDDGDDIACFEIGQKDSVQIIHDFSMEGYEQREKYKTFWDWFRYALELFINTDEDLD